MIRMNVVIFGVLVLLATSATDVRAKEWRGIVPLKSTNAGVERLLGKPNHLGRYEVGMNAPIYFTPVVHAKF